MNNPMDGTIVKAGVNLAIAVLAKSGDARRWSDNIGGVTFIPGALVVERATDPASLRRIVEVGV